VIIQAIQQLTNAFPDCYCEDNNDISTLVWRDTEITKPSDEDIVALATTLRAIEDVRNARYLEYPSIQEQLDMQYWDSVNGTTTWADAIAAVKDAHPKPE